MVKKPKLKIISQTFLTRAESKEEAEEADSYEVDSEEKNSNFETQRQSSKRKLCIRGSNQDIDPDTGNEENTINGVSSSSSSNFVQRPISNELQGFILNKTQQSEQTRIINTNFERTEPIQPIRSSSESSTYSIFNTGSSKKPATGSISRTLSATGSTHRTLLSNSRSNSSNSRSRSVSIPKIGNIKHQPQNHNQKECLDGFNELRSQLASCKSRFF